MNEMKNEVIGKGTWLDKVASALIEREVSLGRPLDQIRVESGIGASGIPHIGSLGDAVRAYGVAMSLRNMGYKSKLLHIRMIWTDLGKFRQVFQNG